MVRIPPYHRNGPVYRRRPGSGILAGWILLWAAATGCSKGSGSAPPPPGPVQSFYFSRASVGTQAGTSFYGVAIAPQVTISFTAPVDRTSAASQFILRDAGGVSLPVDLAFADGDSSIRLSPHAALQYLSRYTISVGAGLLSRGQTRLGTSLQLSLMTALDSSDKFPAVSDSALLDKVQQQTFRYFWDFAHPVSGLARERTTSGDLVTTGGSGFGVMALLVGIHRQFITRTQGLDRMTRIVHFLAGQATTYHGAFPHWMNGTTGATIPFSPNDDGADLVETAYLMQGLLCARQFFDGTDSAEAGLRSTIDTLWNRVEWDWFTQGGQQQLYWHWSPDKGWVMNMPIKGWDEALITYVLAASSQDHAIDAAVYQNGWAQQGAIRNGNSYYNFVLPLGPTLGGPLFFSQYSFLGLDPNGLTDAYADYLQQVTNHTLIQYSYCQANPRNYYGYSDACWGLTASDDPAGYAVHDPMQDNGVVSPTAALSSFPYTPQASMKALAFFYYKLGDRLWGPYGFKDAFRLQDGWFDNDYLAIDQGPILVMIENYRSGLLWNLFTSCPEVRTGLVRLGFQAPYL